jgi:hypothetical protein
MLYVGHFTWDSEEPGEHPFGWFTMLCETESARKAARARWDKKRREEESS